MLNTIKTLFIKGIVFLSLNFRFNFCLTIKMITRQTSCAFSFFGLRPHKSPCCYFDIDNAVGKDSIQN